MTAGSRSDEFYAADARHARAAIAIAAIAVIVLAIAWAFQLIGGYTPCKLCLEQREGYYTAIPLLGLSAIAALLKWPACVPRGLLTVAGLMFAVSMVMGIYQAGAEWSFWAGPNDCGTGGLPTVSGGNLLDEIGETTIIFCDEAALRVLGLSFAGWNVMATAALTTASLVTAVWPPRA